MHHGVLDDKVADATRNEVVHVGTANTLRFGLANESDSNGWHGGTSLLHCDESLIVFDLRQNMNAMMLVIGRETTYGRGWACLRRRHPRSS